MQFYCPQCQNTVDVAAENTITTKLNQTAYKAHCPVCNQDMAAYGAQSTPQVMTAAPETEVNPVDAQAAVDQALHEFGSTV